METAISQIIASFLLNFYFSTALNSQNTVTVIPAMIVSPQPDLVYFLGLLHETVSLKVAFMPSGVWEILFGKFYHMC